MHITTFAISDAGGRQYNQDAYGDAELMAGRCVIVADGAGGHRGGGIASKLLVDAALLYLAAVPQWDTDALIGAIDAASLAVGKRQSQDNLLREMSSTVALLCLDPHSRLAQCAHLGDSRILFFREGSAVQLTKDHSVVQSLADAGLLGTTSSGAKVDRTTLYAAVGAEGDTRPVAGAPIALRDGDAFLLCTDGTWDTVSNEAMSSLLSSSTSVEEWVSG
ncbi:MAG: protein phosphatase 2C domain-containing protein, partial [Pseudomonadota bacterium]|nr:protein phosphatase 2C domain-containing protein [Pseudomonadota bacterium]